MIPTPTGSPPPDGFREARLPLITLSEFPEPSLSPSTGLFRILLEGGIWHIVYRDYPAPLVELSRQLFNRPSSISSRANRHSASCRIM